MFKYLYTRVLAVCFLLAVCLFGRASASVLDRHLDGLSYVEVGPDFSLEDAMSLKSADWTLVKNKNQGLGFSESYYWFKANITGNSNSRDWVLRHRYALIDYLEIYILNQKGVIQQHYVAGDLFDYSERPLLERAFAFPLTLLPGEHYQIYVKSYTKGSMQMPLQLFERNDYLTEVKYEELFAVAFFSVCFAMVLYNFLIWIFARDTGYLYYVFYLLAMINVIALLQGWFFKFLAPRWPEFSQMLVPVGISLALTVGFIFVAKFIRVETKSISVRAAFKLVIAISASTVLLAFVLPYDLSIRLTAVSFFACLLTGLSLIIYDWLRYRRRDVTIFLAAWAMMLAGLFLFLSASFGLLPYNMMTQHAIQLGAMLEVVLLSLGLAERINQQRRDTEKIREEILEVQIRSNQELDARVQERTRDLEILTHKLELASMTDSLTGINNRRYFDDSFYTEYARSYREKTPISLLLIDIDHFKLVNDEYGHQAGDLVLQKVASLLQSQVKRPADTVCRYGGEEFIVTLVNTDYQGGLDHALSLIDSIRALEIRWQDCIIRVTASIGLASVVPSDEDTPANFLMKADSNLYLAKEAGRDRVIANDEIAG